MRKHRCGWAYLIVDFDGPEVWEDLNFWDDKDLGDGWVDYEYQQVRFSIDLGALCGNKDAR